MWSMKRYDALLQEVNGLYDARNPDRADWSDWLGAEHVPFVIEHAGRIAIAKGVDPELPQAAAALHDVADPVMKRDNPAHAETSLRMAREMLQRHGYSAEEIAIIVDDALVFNNCHDKKIPWTDVGRVVATADGLAHLTTNFYPTAASLMAREGKTLADIQKWVLPKIERDIYDKIYYTDERERAFKDYETIRDFFSLPSAIK